MTDLVRIIALLAVTVVCLAEGVPLNPGKNAVPIRGVPQEVYYFPGVSGSSGQPCVLFTPGDGGWRGFAVTLAKQVGL